MTERARPPQTAEDTIALSHRKMVQLSYGALPTKPFFFARLALLGESQSAPALWELVQKCHRQCPTSPTVEATLNALGFSWSAAPSIEEDIAAVADALVDVHDGSHPNCRPCAAVKRINHGWAVVDGRSA